MSLQNVQAEFAEAMFSNTSIDGITCRQNLSIYKNNVKAQLLRALEDVYPCIIKLVGHDFFRVTAKEYIKRYPARSGNLHDYGEYFSHFLAHYQPLKDLAYLSEVAQFEWASHTVYFAARSTPFDANVLATLTPDHYEKIIFILNPAAELLKCHFPILDIIALCHNENAKSIDLSKGGVNLLVIRRDLEITILALTLSEFTFLKALQKGHTLAQALSETEKIDADFNLEKKLPQWVQDKTIVGLHNT